jgi:hypothetical protein
MRLKLPERFKSPAPTRKVGPQPAASSLLARLKLAGRSKFTVPARKVVLLPDSHFFCRTVPVAAAATPAEVAAQVELTLEALAPFPLGQMYHGHFWRPGSKNAFVFAAYRKRFPAEQVETWADAEAVLPAFASMLNAKIEDSTTLLLWSEKSITAIHWDRANDAPVSVLVRELPPEPTDEDRAILRDSLLRDSGAAINVIEPSSAPILENGKADDEFVFRCERADSVFTREQLDVLDARDKEELAARRRARYRDLLLWRVLLGSIAAILLSVTLEFVLIGGGVWQKARQIRVEKQDPWVTKIRLAKSLAVQIEELSTKRMRPLEMISMVSEKLPSSVIFTSATVTNLYTLDVLAQAATSADVDAYRSALVGMPIFEKVEFPSKDLRGQNGLTTFRLIVTFKPDAFKAAPQP